MSPPPSLPSSHTESLLTWLSGDWNTKNKTNRSRTSCFKKWLEELCNTIALPYVPTLQQINKLRRNGFPSYIAKMVKKNLPKMKTHFFYPIESISILGLLDTIRLACDFRRMHNGAAMCVLLCCFDEALASELNSQMCIIDMRSLLPPLCTLLTSSTAKCCDCVPKKWTGC